jgi:lipoprotein signal peptidase
MKGSRMTVSNESKDYSNGQAFSSTHSLEILLATIQKAHVGGLVIMLILRKNIRGVIHALPYTQLC